MLFFAVSLVVGLHLSLLPYCTPAALRNSPFPPPLGHHKLGLVRANAISISNERSVCSPITPLVINDKLTDAMHSWEIGTLAEALTELEWKQLGVFARYSIPPPAQLAPGEAEDVLSIAET